MYSRNGGHVRVAYEPEDDYGDDLQEDEFELYKYGLPPRYDGSRFRRQRSASVQHEVHHDTPQPIEAPTEAADAIQDEQELPCAEDGKLHVTDSDGTPRDTLAEAAACEAEQKGAEGISFGREELLIIALILILAAEGDGDITVILSLLLLVR